MIRYAYNRQLSPPAPFVHVSVQSLAGDSISDSLPAQIDTGADRTVIPGGLVDSLGLLPLDELPFLGLGGHLVALRTSSRSRSVAVRRDNSRLSRIMMSHTFSWAISSEPTPDLA